MKGPPRPRPKPKPRPTVGYQPSPPSPPEGPPCRTFKQTLLSGLIETKESKQKTLDWENYIRGYRAASGTWRTKNYPNDTVSDLLKALEEVVDSTRSEFPYFVGKKRAIEIREIIARAKGEL